MHVAAFCRTASLIVLLAIPGGLLSCAVNPATGQRQISLVGEQEEVRMGRDSDRAIVAELGLYEDPAAQEYVQRLGRGLAARSERADLAWTFRVVDDPTVNAFALPGGYVYITRGIMAHLASEAELCSVIGHEIGHVTARHGVTQMSKARIAEIGIGLGSVVAPEAAERFSGITQAGLGLLFLKYGRDDERQADDLGLRYVLKAGYDPRPMADVFDTLSRVGRSSGSGSTPSWLSTHPPPQDRRQRISQELAKMNQDFARLPAGRDTYEARIENLVFGDDPRQGYFKENVFYHPAMQFQVELPRGWKLEDSRQAVTGVSEAKDARFEITVSSQPTADSALKEFFSKEGISSVAPTQGAIAGLAAMGGGFSATTSGGSLRGRVAFVEHGGRVFRVLGYALPDRWSAIDPVLDRSLRSFKRIADPRFLDVLPSRVHVVRVTRAMSLEEFARSNHAGVSVDTLALLNRLEPGATLRAGGSYKVVSGGKLP
jgi:predicted Zn-dependent protease